MKIRSAWVSLGVAALLGVLAYQLWTLSGARELPDITLVTTRGERVALKTLRGEPLLVTFWATTCTTCMEEMPHLIDLYHELSPRGLRIIGIAMSYDPPNRVLSVQHMRNVPYTIALDIDAQAARAFDGIDATPTTFLIAPDGRIVYHKVGAVDLAEIHNEILAMLATAPSSQAVSTGGGS